MPNIDLLVENGFIITMDGDKRLIDGGFMAVDKGRILEVGTMSSGDSSKYAADEKRDCSGRIVAPGFISTHTHLFQSLLKGLGRDRYLLDWLDASVRTAFRYYNEDYINAAARLGLVDNMHSGVTTVMDYQYCHAQPDLDFVVAEAFESLGMRGVIASARTNTAQFPEEMRSSYVETEEQYFAVISRLVDRFVGHETLGAALAPGIIWDMTIEGFREIRHMADRYEIPITMHVVETRDDDEYCQGTHDTDTISLLEECGVLGPDFSAVHAVYLDDTSLEKIVASGSSVVHCPAANMILGSGSAGIPGMIKAGINVSLATDGPASNDNQDMLESMKLMALQHKLEHRDPSVITAYEVLEAATINGARAVGQADRIGSLEKRKEADFFIYNPSRDPASVPVHDPVTALVYSATSRGVEDVYVRGRQTMAGGHVPGEEDILEEAGRRASRLVEEAGLGSFKANWLR